jgi:glutamyl/glutaminyl-tRNA synthetase
LLQEKKNKLEKEILQKRQKGISQEDLKSLSQMLENVEDDINNECMSDDSKEIPVKKDDRSDSDFSQDDAGEGMLGTNTDITMTAFDEYDSKSMDLKNFQVTDRAIDPEQQAKEEYMRKLMSFRKDELILPEESDDCVDECDENAHEKKKVKDIAGVEEAYEFVERIEDKMNKISNVIRGMDKRMSYNLRLIGSVVAREDQEEAAKMPALVDD